VTPQQGAVQQFWVVEIKQARVTSVKQVSPDRLVPATANQPPAEEVAFSFGTIRWTHVPSATTVEDSWSR
jgi:type VI secretion system secreted protein Hcp